jgi:chromate transporter
VALSGPLVPRLRRSALAGAALDGVNVASLALMAFVTWQLARATLTEWLPIALCAGSFIAIVHYRINATWLIVMAAAIGWLTSR